mgnify:CR=1 FL=1
MDKFFIIANRQKDKELKTARKVEAYLNSKGKSCILEKKHRNKKPEAIIIRMWKKSQRMWSVLL